MRLRVLENSPDESSDFRIRFWAFFGSFDYAQMFFIAGLLGIGLLFIQSIGEQVGTPAAQGFFGKQLAWAAVGFAVWGVFALADYRKLEPLSWAVYLLAVILLVAVLFLGPRISGARSWLILNFGVFKQQLQPSELGKIGLILVLASILGNRNFNIDSWRHLALLVLLIAVPFFLVVIEPDFGGSIIFLPICGAMIFAAGLRMRKIALLSVLFLTIGGVLAANEIFEFKPLLKGYQRNRLLTFFTPETDITDRDYNAYQARLAVGSGGAFGKGIGQGTQNTLGFLPQTVSNNDFIFSVIAEETGFAGCLALLLLIAGLLYTVLRTAWVATTLYGRYLAIGFGVMLFEHIFINLGMSIGLTPVTGLPLPLVSYGGSFLVSTLAMFGVIQSIYRYSKQEAEL